MSSACSNLVPSSSLEIPAHELVQRLGWMQITVQENDREETASFTWPGICYHNYGEFIAHLGKEMSQERKCKIALRQLTGGLECMQNPVAHLLGRPDFDVVELGSGVKPQMDIQEFMLSMPSIVDPARVKGMFLPRHPNYFLDFHRGLDEAIAILTEVTGGSCAPTAGKRLQEAKSVLDATDIFVEMQTDVVTPATDAQKSPSLSVVADAYVDTPSTQETQFNEKEEGNPLEMGAIQDEEMSHSDCDMKIGLLTQPEEEEDMAVNGPKIDDRVIPATSDKPQEEPTSTAPLGDKNEGVHGIDVDPSDSACVDASRNYQDETSRGDSIPEMVKDTASAAQSKSQGNVMKMNSQPSSPTAVSVCESHTFSPTVVSVCDSSGSIENSWSTEVSALSATWEKPEIEPFSDWDTAFQHLKYVGWTQIKSGEIIPPGGDRQGVKGRDFFDEEGAKKLVQRKWGWKGPLEGLKATRTPKKTTGKRAATTPQQSPLSVTPAPGTKRMRRTPPRFSSDGSVEKPTPAKVVHPFFNFRTLMPLLQRSGWLYVTSPNPLKSYCYVLPQRCAKTGVYGVDFFYEEDEVVEYVRNTKGLAKSLKALPTVAPKQKKSS
jgi:hypothetical protein